MNPATFADRTALAEAETVTPRRRAAPCHRACAWTV
jgi:hypothetical protein